MIKCYSGNEVNNVNDCKNFSINRKEAWGDRILRNLSDMPITVKKSEKGYKIIASTNTNEKIVFVRDSIAGFKFKNVHVNLNNTWTEKDLKILSTSSIEEIQITSATLDHLKILFPQKSEAPIWKNLTSLNLIFNSMGDEGANIISKCESLDNLVKLDLRENEIHDSGAEEIAKRDWKNLNCLRLSCNKIGDKGATAIFNAIANKITKLNFLALFCNKITDKGLKHLLSIKASNLRELYIGKNRIGDESAIAISESEICKNLKTLDLRKSKFHDKSREIISKNLKNIKNLNVKCEVEEANLLRYVFKKVGEDIDVEKKLK